MWLFITIALFFSSCQVLSERAVTETQYSKSIILTPTISPKNMDQGNNSVSKENGRDKDSIDIIPNPKTMPLIQFGYTYHSPDGNRLVRGSASLPSAQVIDIPISGTPQWVAAVQGENGSIWAVVLDDGRVEAFQISGVNYSKIEIYPEQIPPGMPPLLVVEEDFPQLAVVDSADASTLTHPIIVGKMSPTTIYIARNGDLVASGEEGMERLEVNALPDARILLDEQQRLLLLTDPTRRYTHGVLGDGIEATSITLVETTPQLKVALKFVVDPAGVFEGIAPIWVDLNHDQQREIIVTRSDNNQGAQIIVFSEEGKELAKSPGVGQEFRWRNQMAAAAFDPDGELELVDVLTPHIGGVVEFFRLEGNRLNLTAQRRGYTSHVIGSRNLDMALGGDFDGDGKFEVLIPTQDRRQLDALQHQSSGAEVIWSLPLTGYVTTNIAATTSAEGLISIGVGTDDQMLRVWVPQLVP